jgi:hypothetical protein
LSTAFKIENTPGYIAPHDKKNLFLSKASYKEIFQNKRAGSLFIAFKLALVAIFAFGFLFFHLLGMIILFFSLAAISIVLDKELLRLARVEISPGRLEFGGDFAEGWYPDPWAFGKPNLVRYWDGAEWSVDNKVAQKKSLPDRNIPVNIK